MEIDAEIQQFVDSDEHPKNATAIENRPLGTALCLSGGGYRAALFHLGVLRCLHEMGILKKVELISSVSGGSILSAFFARRLFELRENGKKEIGDFETDIAAPFRDIVKNDIRTWPFFRYLPINWFAPNRRALALARNYTRLITTAKLAAGESELSLGDLPEQPKFVYCATDMTFGVNWEFSRERVGDYQAGHSKKPDWPLALAVMASSSFPPIFGPYCHSLDPRDFTGGNYRPGNSDDRDALVRELTWSDGGVYDNYGMEPLNDRYKVVIVSDGGAPFGYVGRSNIFGRLMRNVTVALNQAASLRKRIFFTGVTKSWYKGTLISIARLRESKPGIPFDGYSNPEVRSMIAGVRTDLDRFTDDEARILENHGYFEAFRRVTGKSRLEIPNPNFTLKTPHGEWEDEDKVRKALENSSKKFFLPRLLGIQK